MAWELVDGDEWGPVPAEQPDLDAPIKGMNSEELTDEVDEYTDPLPEKDSPEVARKVAAHPPAAVNPVPQDEDLACYIRAVFSDCAVRQRDQAIRDVAHEIGYRRVSGQVRSRVH